MSEIDFAVAIIAGGKSTRMGTPKAFILLNEQPLLTHIIKRISNLGQRETLLITNQPDLYKPFGLPMFQDIIPERGALGGIYTALSYCNSPYVLTIACDTPFLKPQLFRYMLALQQTNDHPFDVVVPQADGHPQGLHALYRKTCLPVIKDKLDINHLQVAGFYSQVRTRYLEENEYASFDPLGISFFNINTPEDLEHAREIAATSNE